MATALFFFRFFEVDRGTRLAKPVTAFLIFSPPDLALQIRLGASKPARNLHTALSARTAPRWRIIAALEVTAMSISVIHAGQVASALVIAASVRAEPPSRPSEIVAVDLLVRLMTRFFTTPSQLLR